MNRASRSTKKNDGAAGLSGVMIVGLWNNYLTKNRKDYGPPVLIESVEFEAPYYPVWPPESHTRIFFDSPDKTKSQESYTRQVIANFMERAFRRPANDNEIQRYMDFWNDIKGDFAIYEDGVERNTRRHSMLAEFPVSRGTGRSDSKSADTRLATVLLSVEFATG